MRMAAAVYYWTDEDTRKGRAVPTHDNPKAPLDENRHADVCELLEPSRASDCQRLFPRHPAADIPKPRIRVKAAR